MTNIVISIGGSLISTEGKAERDIKEWGHLIEESAKERKIYVVVGGGPVAREYIRTARNLGADETFLDDLGITITRANARLMIAALPNAYPVPAASLEEAIWASATYPVVVMGGTHPGHTTDAVAAMLAERSDGRLIIATNVDGVYTTDPATDPSATRIEEMTPQQLVDMPRSTEAGASSPVDLVAARIIARSKIPTFILNGNDLRALNNAIAGRSFVGTRVI